MASRLGMLCWALLATVLSGCVVQEPQTPPTPPTTTPNLRAGLFSAADGSEQPLTPEAFAKLQYHGQGSYRWPDGRQYSGAWHDSQPHGQGNWSSPDGSRYSGGWQSGLYQGSGSLIDANGQRYEGNFQTGKRHGQGLQVSADGQYEGAWANDLPQGQGTFKGADGSVYSGAYQAGDRHGAGRFTSASGSVYDGDWLLDEASGFGVLVEIDGGRREGQWLAGVSSGYGSYAHPAGLRYEGNWDADKRDGFGAEERPDGSRYEGNWVADKPQGQGTLTLSNGTIHSGIWHNGKPEGLGTLTHPGGYQLAGTWRDGLLSGGAVTLTGTAINNRYDSERLFDAQGHWLPEAESWLRNHAEIGNASAAWLLIERGAAADAAGLLPLAAQSGIAMAQYELGKRLLDHDLRSAIDWLNKAANGTPHSGGAAHFLLGSLYHFGDLLAQDQDQAESHYLIAIDRGSIAARRNLAAMLATTSIGYLRDPERALGVLEPIALLYRSPGLLDALAVVYHANERAADAADTQQAALAALQREAAAGTAADQDLDLEAEIRNAMQQRLLQYQSAAEPKP
ncbi:MAG: hypothetical protein AB8B93_17200 [Pseudomonadales bacterium]